MNVEEAKTALSFHSASNPNIDDVRWQTGFLCSLRPYQGMSQIEKNFHEIVSCLRVLALTLSKQKLIDKGLGSNIAGIIGFGRMWAVHEDGMLRRNNLITPDEAFQIAEWLDCIEYIWMMILDTDDETVIFEIYDRNYPPS